MAPEFVKNFKIVRLTENLPVWKKGVYNAEMYDDGTVIIHNPSKNYPNRSYTYSIHKSWFSDTWAYHYEPEDQVQDKRGCPGEKSGRPDCSFGQERDFQC